jgi:hypothetical protein
MQDLFGLLIKLFKGIQSDYPFNPIVAATLFTRILSEHDYIYDHDDGLGYVYKDDNPVMLVYWDDHGVTFKEHEISDAVMTVIQIAYHIICEMDNFYLMAEDTEDLSDEESISEWL